MIKFGSYLGICTDVAAGENQSGITATLMCQPSRRCVQPQFKRVQNHQFKQNKHQQPFVHRGKQWRGDGVRGVRAAPGGTC